MVLPDANLILLYGGSFDPPHVAHLILPLLAMEAIGADAVAYVPAAVAPHKQGEPTTPAPHRLQMLRLALAGAEHAVVLTDEIDRADRDDRPSYTVDTLEAVHDRLGDGVTLRLLIGADMLRSFDTWHRPQRIIELAEPVVMLRPPDTRQSLLAALPAGYDPADWARRLVDLPLLDISSTQIRQRVAAGRPITGFVPPAVAGYIDEHDLYRC